MTKPLGHIAGDMKWFAYRYPQKPDTLMALGSILTRCDDLESSLNYEAGPSGSSKNTRSGIRQSSFNELFKPICQMMPEEG